MKNTNPFPKGLTLIELLMVVIIIMIVMSIGANTYRDQRRHVMYNDAVLKVNNLIKTARSYAMTSRSVYDPCVFTEEYRVYVPEGGYGVYILRSATPGASRAVLFANTRSATELEAAKFQETVDCNTSDLIEEDYRIPGEADLVGLWTDKGEPPSVPPIGIGGGSNNQVAIIFKPPYGDATIAVNDLSPIVTSLNDIYLQFRRPQSPASTPSQYIHFNRLAGFPEIERE